MSLTIYDKDRKNLAGRSDQRYGGLWQCVVYGFGGVRMLGGKLRIDPKLPEAWNKLSYTILWKGQKLAVTVTKDSVHIVNESGTTPISLEICGKQYLLVTELEVRMENPSPQ